MTKVRFLPLGIVAALCFGCAEERSLEPPPLAKLPAMNLTDDPVAAISDEFSPPDSLIFGQTEYTIAIPESVLAAIRPDDIRLTYHAYDGCGADVFVLEPARRKWRPVARRRPSAGCTGEISGWSWLLSMVDSRPTKSFLDQDNALRLKGELFGVPSARIVRYNAHYRFIAFGQQARVGPLACDTQNVWVVLRPFTEADNPIGDSIIVIDLSGTRVRSFFLPDRLIYAMAWSDSDLWIVDGMGPLLFSRMDESGHLSPAFVLPEQRDAIAQGMAWSDGRLWIPEPHTQRLQGINVQKSVDSGYAVIDREIQVPFRFSYSNGIAADGEYLYVLAGRFYKLRLSGEVIDSLPLPVWAADGHLAWDGESMWILHRGPRETMSYAQMLSRFLIP